MPDENRKLDEAPVPGGLYIDGGIADRATGKHFGGRVLDANGTVLATYEKDQENPGADGFRFDEDKGRVVPIGPKMQAPPPPPTPPDPDADARKAEEEARVRAEEEAKARDAESRTAALKAPPRK